MPHVRLFIYENVEDNLLGKLVMLVNSDLLFSPQLGGL